MPIRNHLSVDLQGSGLSHRKQSGQSSYLVVVSASFSQRYFLFSLGGYLSSSSLVIRYRTGKGHLFECSAIHLATLVSQPPFDCYK